MYKTLLIMFAILYMLTGCGDNSKTTAPPPPALAAEGIPTPPHVDDPAQPVDVDGKQISVKEYVEKYCKPETQDTKILMEIGLDSNCIAVFKELRKESSYKPQPAGW